MTFDEVLTQVLELLQREKRVSYRALKLRFDINDDYIEGIKDEFIYAKKLAMDEENRVLVWTGNAQETVAQPTRTPQQPAARATPLPQGESPSTTTRLPEALWTFFPGPGRRGDLRRTSASITRVSRSSCTVSRCTFSCTNWTVFAPRACHSSLPWPLGGWCSPVSPLNIATGQSAGYSESVTSHTGHTGGLT